MAKKVCPWCRTAVKQPVERCWVCNSLDLNYGVVISFPKTSTVKKHLCSRCYSRWRYHLIRVRLKRLKKGGSMKKALAVAVVLVLLLPGVVRADRVEELSQQFDNMQRKKLNIQRQVVDLQQQIEQINEDMLRLQGRHAERELVVVEEKKAAERAARIAEELAAEENTHNE